MIGEYYSEMYEYDCFSDDEYSEDNFIYGINEDQNDDFANAKEFRVKRGIFNVDCERLEFNSISNHITEQIIQVANLLAGCNSSCVDIDLVNDKLYLLTKEQQKSIVNKAIKLTRFVKNEKK